MRNKKIPQISAPFFSAPKMRTAAAEPFSFSESRLELLGGR
jgi:hypothetical protein